MSGYDDDDGEHRLRASLDALRPIFAHAAIGDFSRDVELPEGDDEVTELYMGIQVMLEVIRLQLDELRELNLNLEAKVEQRTADLAHVQAELAQSQKMESLGRLAGGVAHEFNNQLGILILTAEHLLESLPHGHPAERDAAQIISVGRRSASIVSQLLGFSRRQLLEPRVLDLNDALRDGSRMFRHLLREDLHVEFHGGQARLWLRIDPTQLNQIILNLVANAMDAMPRGGTLRVSTGTVATLPTVTFPAAGGAPGPWVYLSVRDTGTGMTQEVIDRIFEPFFTTKERGRGTGLGLSMVHGIVSQSGGHVAVHSVPRQGTTFELYFPEVPEPANTEQRPVRAIEGGSGGVLLVEDEPMLRELLRELLEGHGYRVYEAAHGAAGLALYETHRGTIDAVITDVVMPRAGGPTLVAEIRKHDPDVAVVFLSGYPVGDGKDAASGRLDDSSTLYLQKPVTRDVLLGKLDDLLARRARSRRGVFGVV